MADRTVSVALRLITTNFTSGLRKAQQETKKFGDDLASQAKKNKGNWDTVGNTLGGVGLAAAAGVGIAVKKFADFDKAMSNVKAATHETAGNMEELRQAAIKAGKDTAFSATEAAQGIESLAKAGVSTKDILNGGLAGALDLAAAGELGVADAAETAATAMTQFKLKGSDVPHIADLLAAAAGKAQGEVSDMAMGLKQGGLVAAQMGLSIEETTGTLAAFASAGLIGSDAGTSFKTMLLALANPSEKAAGTMKDLGINVYDAQGAFMGVAPLAEQLKAKLGNLSEEQRNSALATIFGSDAIRAASVLYQNGAAGIADWTTKVNDQGFAAETAAIKTDNLKGDIERLGGSIDTALIQQGSGANDALRAVTQGVGFLVDGIGSLPEDVSKIGLALGGIAAVGGLGAGGLLKAASAASEAKEAWQNLGTVGKRLTLSMGAVGVAITAGLILYGAFSKKNEEAAKQAENLRDTLDDQTGAITANTRSYVANELAQNGLAQKAKDLGLSLGDVTDAALGNQSALDQVVTALDNIITTNERYQRGSKNSGANEQAEAAKRLKGEILGLNGSLTEAQRTQKLAAEGAIEHKSAQEIQAEAVKKANEKIKTQAEDLDNLIDKMQEASTEALSLSDAQIDYQEALAKANESIDENGKTIDKRTGKIRLDTKEGIENQKALNDLAKSTNNQTESMVRSGTANDTTRKTAEAARKKFVDVAMQMGLNKTAAEKLSREYIDIPDKVNTDVTNSAAAAKAKAVDYKDNGLAKIPKTAPTSVEIRNLHQAKEDVGDFAVHVSQTLRGIKDEAIRVNLAYTSSLGQNPLNKKMVGYATGGGIHGPGTGTSDDIPIMASDGEHMWTAREVQAAGGHGAVKKMRQAVLKGYAAGGEVHVGLGAAVPSDAAVSAVADRVAGVYGREIAKKSQEFGVFPGGPGGKQNFRGKTLNARTVAMVLAAERNLGAQFHITQGSYSTSVAASAGTHAGGGVMDTNGPRGWGAAVQALRQVGFAAWHRTPSQGPWGHHIHSVAIGDPTASQAAKNQVASYKRGGDGLGHGMAKGGPVKPLVFDKGGLLPPGPSFVYNGTGTPEPVGHDFLKKSDLDGLAIQLDAGDVTFTGHIRVTARHEINESNRQIKRRVGGR